MDWNYVWASIAVNFLIVFVIPRLIKKPTGLKTLDDIVLFLNSQKSFILASSIVTGLVIYLAIKWVDSAGGGEVSGGTASPEKF
jgi:hypothetical protein